MITKSQLKLFFLGYCFTPIRNALTKETYNENADEGGEN